MATLCQGFFSRSKLGDTGTELALLDHILASPGIVRGAAILTTPAGTRGSREKSPAAMPGPGTGGGN